MVLCLGGRAGLGQHGWEVVLFFGLLNGVGTEICHPFVKNIEDRIFPPNGILGG